jgi:hypothetical protein
LETRKLRLLLLAFLRGVDLIKQGYPQGVRSILREWLILDGIEAQEVARQSFESQLVQAAAVGSHLDHRKVRKVVEDIEEQLDRMHKIGLMHIHGRIVRKAKGSVDALVQLYQSLQKTEFFDLVREEHYKMNPTERPDATI